MDLFYKMIHWHHNNDIDKDNNNKYHSVKNDGNEDRIHLLIDWKLK